MATSHDTTDESDLEAGQSDVRTRSVSWTVPTDAPLHRHTKTALFYHDGTRWRVQHVRQVVLRQKGQTVSDLDDDVQPSDLPAWVIREAGLSLDDLAADDGHDGDLEDRADCRPLATDGGDCRRDHGDGGGRT